MTDQVDTQITDVIFKKEGKDVVAFFPGLPGNDQYDCTCYAHVGQHSAASLQYLGKCRPAHPSEYQDLYRELQSIGYNLRIVRRRTQKHDKARSAEIKWQNNSAIAAAGNFPITETVRQNKG